MPPYPALRASLGFGFADFYPRLETFQICRAGHRAVHRLADDAMREVLDCDEDHVLFRGRDQGMRRIGRDVDERAGWRDDAFAVDRPFQGPLDHEVELLVLVRVHARAGAARLVDIADQHAAALDDAAVGSRITGAGVDFAHARQIELILA